MGRAAVKLLVEERRATDLPWTACQAARHTFKDMKKALIIMATLAAGLALFAGPAGAINAKPTPTIGSTITVRAVPHLNGGYSITLLQVYTTELYGGGPYGPHPVVVRVRVTNTGSKSLYEDPQRDSAVILHGHSYRAAPVVQYSQSGWPWPVWQLTSEYLSNSGTGFLDSTGVGGTGLVGCPTPASPYPNLYQGISRVRTYGPIKVARRRATQTCVVFSLPRKLDRSVIKFCWTPAADERSHQATYCWAFDNDKPAAI